MAEPRAPPRKAPSDSIPRRSRSRQSPSPSQWAAGSVGSVRRTVTQAQRGGGCRGAKPIRFGGLDVERLALPADDYTAVLNLRAHIRRLRPSESLTATFMVRIAPGVNPYQEGYGASAGDHWPPRGSELCRKVSRHVIRVDQSCSDLCGGATDVRAIHPRDDRPEETRAGREDREVDLHGREAAEELQRRELLPRPEGGGRLPEPVGVEGGDAGERDQWLLQGAGREA